MQKIELSPRLTAGLDAARAVSAIYVVIHHVALTHNFHGPAAIFKSFGHQAVMMFFLLSGFLIYANERHRVGSDLKGYAWRRIARIYPTLIVALIVSALVFLFNGTLQSDFSASELVGTLFALQDTRSATPGTMFEPFLANSPLWSLAYEIWFYALFPVANALFVRLRQLGTAIIGATCTLAYLLYALAPNHFLVMTAYFAIWWLGAMIAESYGRGGRSILSTSVASVALLAVVVVACLPAFTHHGPRSEYPFLQINHLASGLMIAALLFGPVGRLAAAAALPFKAIIAPVATISYGLYVLHWPLLTQWAVSYTPWGMILSIPLLVVAAIVADPVLAKQVKCLVQKVPSGARRTT